MSLSAIVSGNAVSVSGFAEGRVYVFPRDRGVYVDARDGAAEAAFVEVYTANREDPLLFANALELPALRFEPVPPNAIIKQERIRRWDARCAGAAS